MKRFRKIYLEISNVCNLSCHFCPGTKREKHFLSISDFSDFLYQIQGYTDYLYFHLMGEPLLHPNLDAFLNLAGAAGLKVILTTNGVLLPKTQELLLSSPALHKINVSLHAFEANDLQLPFENYLKNCFCFGKLSGGEKLVVYRLWNGGGANEKNAQILDVMEQYFPKPWTSEPRGTRIAQRCYLEYGHKFSWPDLAETDMGSDVFCYGLKDQIGILCDGTVVPCCLDHDGDLALGNLHQQNLEEILQSPRAVNIQQGFSQRCAREELCRKCGYARRF